MYMIEEFQGEEFQGLGLRVQGSGFRVYALYSAMFCRQARLVWEVLSTLCKGFVCIGRF